MGWEALLGTLVAPLVADLHDPHAASALLPRSYRPETRRSYTYKMRALFLSCKMHQCAPLPASVPTLIGWVLFDRQRGALAPPSLEKNLSSVASLHRLACYDDTTKEKLMRLAAQNRERI